MPISNRAEFIAQKMGNKLQLAAKQEGKDLSAEDILSQLEQADPTPHKQFLQWIANQYVANQFRLEDYPRIKEELSQFQILTRRNKLEQKDINRYSYYSLSDAIEKAIGSSGITKSTHDLSDCQVLYNGPLGILAIPQTETAAKELGKGTKWCTAANENNMFDYYSDKGDLFVWIDKTGEKYQFWFNGYKNGKLTKYDKVQLMDARDREITDEKWKELKQIAPIAQLIEQLGQVILTNTECESLYYYTRDVIKDRWLEAEPLIMKDPQWAYCYALKVIKDRWLDAEPYLIKDPRWACYYVRNIIKDRWPEAEPYIMKNPESAHWYAEKIIKDRWPEAEPHIMKDPRTVYYYAQFVIKNRWPEAEPYIAKDPSWAYCYAEQIIKNRWPEAEPYIMKDPVNWSFYTKCFGFN